MVIVTVIVAVIGIGMSFLYRFGMSKVRNKNLISVLLRTFV